MSAAHTPYAKDYRNGGIGASPELRAQEEKDANARLIAQLAEALRACEAALSAQMLDGCAFEELNEARDKVRAALTAAGVKS